MYNFLLQIDKCGLMWVVDTGRVETFVNPRRVCRPKLVIFDLNNHDNVYGNLFKFTIIYFYYFIN